MKISELAHATDTPAETIRFYEREGLLSSPARGPNNYRRYEERHLQRLNVIRRGRMLGFSLDEIRGLLQVLDEPEANCLRISELLQMHLTHITQRLTELKAMQAQLIALQAACQHDGPVQACGSLRAWWALPAVEVKPSSVHRFST